MPTNAQAIADLEAAKTKLDDQCDDATGTNYDDLLTAINKLVDEIGAIQMLNLNTSPYVPQTDAFKAVTAEATAFLALLNKIKTTFAAVAGLAAVIDKVITYIK